MPWRIYPKRELQIGITPTWYYQTLKSILQFKLLPYHLALKLDEIVKLHRPESVLRSVHFTVTDFSLKNQKIKTQQESPFLSLQTQLYYIYNTLTSNNFSGEDTIH